MWFYRQTPKNFQKKFPEKMFKYNLFSPTGCVGRFENFDNLEKCLYECPLNYEEISEFSRTFRKLSVFYGGLNPQEWYYKDWPLDIIIKFEEGQLNVKFIEQTTKNEFLFNRVDDAQHFLRENNYLPQERRFYNMTHEFPRCYGGLENDFRIFDIGKYYVKIFV